MRIRGRQKRGIPLLKEEEFLRDSPSFLCLCCCGEGLGLLYNNNPPLLTAFSLAAFIALRLTNSSFFFSTILTPFSLDVYSYNNNNTNIIYADEEEEAKISMG
jgi:hypothetical protein